MLTTEQIRTVAQAKVKDYQKCMDLLEPVLTALERFSGKSITGNRTKIIDAIKQIDNNLFVGLGVYFMTLRLLITPHMKGQ